MTSAITHITRRLGVLRGLLRLLLPPPEEPGRPVLPPPTAAPGPRLNIVIIAEMSIPACRDYRVYHKADALRQLDCSVTTVNWWDPEQCREAIQLADAVIFYRVGAQPATQTLFAETTRLGIPSFFDTDDIIFDEEIFSQSQSFRSSSRPEQDHLLEGVRNYRAALQYCDHAIASTAPLALRMSELTAGKTFLIENALNVPMVRVAERILTHPIPRASDKVVIGYGSGTATHDDDFEEAMPALLQILQTYDFVELVIQGPLQLPADFAPYRGRIVQLPLMNMNDYLQSLATWDISIACLKSTDLNRAKSAVKFIEAGLMKVPSVCSALEPYIGVVEQGITGYLAASKEQWVEALSLLIENPTLRLDIADRAFAAVRGRCDQDHIAETQIKPLLANIQVLPVKFKIIVVNDAPLSDQSGAVANFVHTAMHDRDLEVIVFSVLETTGQPHNSLHTVRQEGITTIGIADRGGLPAGQYWNNDVAQKFARVLEACRPDLVSIFDVKRLGFSLAQTCLARQIPYLISLHDDWWLCEPSAHGMMQPYLPAANDLRKRAAQTDNPELYYHRYFELREALLSAAGLLAPSDSQRGLYISHGLPASRIVSATIAQTGHVTILSDQAAADATEQTLAQLLRRIATGGLLVPDAPRVDVELALPRKLAHVVY